MGVKKKKPLKLSKNAFRWQKIENKLIRAGYIRSFNDKEWCVWVDCVSSGTDIIYRLSSLESSARNGAFSLSGKFSSPVFEVMSRKAPNQVHSRCEDIEEAIKMSRGLQL